MSLGGGLSGEEGEDMPSSSAGWRKLVREVEEEEGGLGMVVVECWMAPCEDGGGG